MWDNPSAQLFALLGRMIGRSAAKTSGRPFTAVHPVTLDIARGECIGIIGRNGAGKSTLLQMIAGTLRPTQGTVKVNGRVAALLELGSGFNPDFTGRENIHLNATILGLTATEIAAKFDSIVAYSGIEEFIDQPVHTYSSGMTLRLAFAVCVHVDADILIIDEALAVGDARFQFKCHATLDQMLKEGRTIIFVSHDTNSVKRMCQTAVLLERGEMLVRGSPNDVTNIYTKLITSPHGVVAIRDDIAALAAQAPLQAVEEGAGGKGQEAEGEGRGAKGGGQGAKGEEQGAEAGSKEPRAEGGGQGADGRREQGAGSKVENTDVPLSPAAAESIPSPFSLLPSPEGADAPGPASLLTEERSHQQVSDKEYCYGGETGKITSVELTNEEGQPRLSFLTGGKLRVRIRCEANEPIVDPIYALTLKGVNGQEIYGTNTYFQNQTPPPVAAGGVAEATFDLQLNVQPGVYFISVGWVRLVNSEVVVIQRRYDVVRFDVFPSDKSFGIAHCPTRITVREGKG